MRYFIQQLLLTLHTLLLEKSGVIDEKSTIEIDVYTIQQLATAFEKAHAEMKYAVLPQLPLELLVVEWTSLEEVGIKNKEVRVDEKIERTKVIAHEGKQSHVVLKKEIGVETASSHSASSGQAHVPRSDNNDDTAFFHQLLDVLKVENHMLAGVLRSCKMKRDEKTLIIEAPSAFHKERLEDTKALNTIETMCKRIAGHAMTITVMLK